MFCIHLALLCSPGNLHSYKLKWFIMIRAILFFGKNISKFLLFTKKYYCTSKLNKMEILSMFLFFILHCKIHLHENSAHLKFAVSSWDLNCLSKGVPYFSEEVKQVFCWLQWELCNILISTASQVGGQKPCVEVCIKTPCTKCICNDGNEIWQSPDGYTTVWERMYFTKISMTDQLPCRTGRHTCS